jgi:crotonobetainyl-CoA:carnitine CoA-transferase CaiB-like acyl-CoA transferase
MAGPLSGYRILDMSRVLAGPWAGQMLADLGAEVIKIERPGAGDDTRQWGPPYLKDAEGEDTSESAYYLCANRGKKSVTIDITQTRGQKIIRQLAAQSDVLIENFKVGGLKKYGLDYEQLKDCNPKLVYCSITGFGQTGPYAERPGYDFLIQGMGGLMSITGVPDNEAGGGPVKVGVAVSDLATGLYAINAIQAALLERVQSGEGQHIDIALLDVQAAMLANQASNYLVGGVVPIRLGNAQPNIVPYQAFATTNGEIILAVGNDGQFSRFCKAVDNPELATDSRFSTNEKRVRNRPKLCDIIARLLEQENSEYWLEKFESLGVPCGPINSIEQVFSDPQILARNMVVDLEHPLSPNLHLPGNPINYSRTRLDATGAPPLLGEHTESVLREKLEYSADEIKLLKEQGVID